MEPVGLGVGLISLAGLFSQVLECFEYVYVARQMGKSYTYFSLRLDNAQLRLTRWRSSVELQHVPDREHKQARAIMNTIITIFEDAKALSDEFKADNGDHVARDLQVEGTDVSLTTANGDRNISVLMEAMKRISFGRINPTASKLKKTKWAIYSESHMKDLVERVSSLTTELIDLFPNAKGTQDKLCAVEIWELTEGLRELREAVEGQDDILTAALGKMLDPVETKVNRWNNHQGSTVGVQAEAVHGGIKQEFGRG